MKKQLLILVFNMVASVLYLPAQHFGLVIHGGAGTITREGLSEERQRAYEEALTQALQTGYAILESGGTAERAVIETIKLMEDNPLFNAGRGSVLNADGKVEMDASIMLGNDLDAGAVAGVSLIKNPIEAAALVMHKSPHVMLSNRGADAFARINGLTMERPSYFITERSKNALERAKEEARDQGYAPAAGTSDDKFGTVGVVALDQDGNLAAGTSTGGMTNKMHNRIGDSPIIGAGTYANNSTCAVSCTGHGEYFIRLGVAREVSSLMQYKGYDLDMAASFVIHKQLRDLGGTGGLIAIDKQGNVSMPFNTHGMFRAFMTSDGRREVSMFGEG